MVDKGVRCPRQVDVSNVIFTSQFLQRDIGPKKLLLASQPKGSG